MGSLRSIWCVGLGLCLTSGIWAAQTAIVAANGAAGALGRDDPFGSLDAAPGPAANSRPAESNEPPPDLYMETVVLRFLDASSVQTVLQRMQTSHGAVSINKANNSIVLCDTRENLDKMIGEIKKADRTPQLVMVEAIILDVQLMNDSEIGVNWDLLSDSRPPFGYRQNLSTSRLTSTPEIESGSTDPKLNTVGTATAFNTLGSGGDFSVIFGTVRSVLHLVQQKRNVNILAAPRTMVVSGKKATINAVEEIPYREVEDTAAGGQGALTSTKFKNVGVTLDVEVVVTDDNDIYLTVSSEQSARTGASQDGVPVVDSRKANTSLLLKDGQTVVIGGLRREEDTRTVNQIPLLGDLPLIGFLFRSTTLSKTKSELVVLLSPRLNPGGPLPAQTAGRLESVRRENWLSDAVNDRQTSKDPDQDPTTR
jgi:type II secretory pathway component GspD/PulD (secretin)